MNNNNKKGVERVTQSLQVKGEGAGLHATAPCGSGEVVDVDHLLFDIGKLCARSLLFHPPQFLQLEELDLKEEQGLTWVSSVRCRPKVVRARLGAARTVWVADLGQCELPCAHTGMRVALASRR